MAATEAPDVSTAAHDAAAGLDRAELEQLSDVDLQALGVWHASVCGDDDGRMWWPNAVRRLSLDERLELATDPVKAAAWERLERLRCEDPDTGYAYFTEAYGHVQPEDGPPLPFTFWEPTPGGMAAGIGATCQREVLDAIHRELRVIVLKARQLGLTWLALHYAVWLLVLAQHTPNARVLALSKHGGDATKLLARARRIIALLPPYLHVDEASDTRASLTKMKLVGRGSLQSLAGSPEAARSETATFVLADEFGFIRHKGAQPTWTALIPTMGRRGKAVLVSTGNGPPEQPGDGQAFARIYQQARDGVEAGNAGRLYPIFLPSSTHPDRDQAWHDEARKDFLSGEEFGQEYPEDERTALAGVGGVRVFIPAGLRAVEQLGARYDELLWAGELEPFGGTVALAVDFGEFTHWLPIWPLEDGGIYVPPGEVDGGGHVHMTVSDGIDMVMENIAAWQDADPLEDVPLIPVEEIRYDAAGVESSRTVVERVEDLHVHRFVAQRRYKRQLKRKVDSPRLHAVAFSKWKGLSYDYLRGLVKRAGDGERTRILAVSPENRVLLRQMRGMELDEEGRIIKGDDHGPDCLAAGAKPVAVRFLSAHPDLKRTRRQDAALVDVSLEAAA